MGFSESSPRESLSHCSTIEKSQKLLSKLYSFSNNIEVLHYIHVTGLTALIVFAYKVSFLFSSLFFLVSSSSSGISFSHFVIYLDFFN